MELCASLTKDEDEDVIQTIAVGLHELISIADGADKDPFEFFESIQNVLANQKAWLCLMPGFDVTMGTLISYFKKNCEEAKQEKTFFEDKLKPESD